MVSAYGSPVARRFGFGRALRQQDTPAFGFAELVAPRGLVLGPHAHDCGQISLVFEGEYVETLRGRREQLAPGSVVFRPPGEVHSNRFSEEVRHVIVAFHHEGAWWERLWGEAGPVHLRSVLLEGVCAEIHRELRRDDPACCTALEGLVMVLVARASRLLSSSPAAREPRWLSEAVVRIEHSYAGRIELSMLARSLGVHRATLASAMRRYRGISVRELVTSLRLRDAIQRLSESDEPLSEIALATGFCDQAHLGRIFRRRLGQTPAAFRRAQRALR